MAEKKKNKTENKKKKWVSFEVTKVDMSPDESLVTCMKAGMTVMPGFGCCQS